MTESAALWDESLPKTALPSPVGQQLWKQEQVAPGLLFEKMTSHRKLERRSF